jgi:hypothetical protein
MRKIAKDMFYNVGMVNLEEVYIAITGRQPPKNKGGEALWHEIRGELEKQGLGGVSIYLGSEDGHIAVYDVEKHERIQVNDLSELLALLERLKEK